MQPVPWQVDYFRVAQCGIGVPHSPRPQITSFPVGLFSLLQTPLPSSHRFCVVHLFARGKRSFNCSRGFLTKWRFNMLSYVWGPSLVRLVTCGQLINYTFNKKQKKIRGKSYIEKNSKTCRHDNDRKSRICILRYESPHTDGAFLSAQEFPMRYVFSRWKSVLCFLVDGSPEGSFCPQKWPVRTQRHATEFGRVYARA